MKRETSGTVRTADGAVLRTMLRSPESGAARRVALVHSLALDGAVWAPVARRLVAAGAEVITFDCRGHGRSTRARGPYDLRLFAGDLAAVLDGAGWPSAIVGGASMGGSVALAFATAYPERVEALGLVDTTAWYGPDAPLRWRERAEQARASGFGALLDFQQRRWFGDDFRRAHPEVTRRLTRVFLANDLDSYGATCEMLGAFDLREAVRAIRVPTAVVVGEDDYATPPAMARELASLIPGATLETLAGARHLTVLERPAEVAAALTRLIGRRAGGASGTGADGLESAAETG